MVRHLAKTNYTPKGVVSPDPRACVVAACDALVWEGTEAWRELVFSDRQVTCDDCKAWAVAQLLASQPQ